MMVMRSEAGGGMMMRRRYCWVDLPRVRRAERFAGVAGEWCTDDDNGESERQQASSHWDSSIPNSDRTRVNLETDGNPGRRSLH
jgi:hypothetical protein